MDTTQTVNHLSLCSGYEGIGLGLRRIFTNLREVAHVEIETYAIANLVSKMEEGWLDPAPIHTDVKTFPYRKFRGCVDILSGGFPCQPFSHAGLRKATDDPRHLFPYILGGIRECRPSIVFLENVDGIISARTGSGESVLKYVLRSLEDVGYRSTAGIFSASEVGAPHRRKRVFILAHTDNAGLEGCAEAGDVSRVWSQSHEQFTGCGSGETEWSTESDVGRVVDGCSHRVDRLRLLGNGVVPATAAKAFLVLSERLNLDSEWIRAC